MVYPLRHTLTGGKMKNLSLGCFALALLLTSCTVGGGGGIQVSGRVLSISTGEGPDPPATVTIAGRSTTTVPTSGTFFLGVPSGASEVQVTHSVFPPFVFTVPPITQSRDLGTFYIGPQTVTIVGTVLDASTNQPIGNVVVSFAGRRALSNSAGEFTLEGVAYDPNSEFILFGIPGRAEHPLYLPAEFFVNQSPIGGVITLAPILMAPLSDPNPPPPPFNLWGIVSLEGGGNPQGTLVTLEEGGNPIRRYNVGSDGRYAFWAVPGSYTILFEKEGFQPLRIAVTLTQPNQVIRNDVTLVR